MKLSGFEECEVVLLLPKVNKDEATDVVVTIVLDVPLFATLLKPAMLAVLTNNVVPVV